MGKVIGRKSIPVGVMYVGVAVALPLLFFAILKDVFYASEIMIIVFFFAILEIVDIVIVYQYFRVPKEAIILTNNYKVYLPGHAVTLSFDDIINVNYKQARGRGITYKWGKVIIISKYEKYSINYLEECEHTANELMRIKYELQNNVNVNI